MNHQVVSECGCARCVIERLAKAVERLESLVPELEPCPQWSEIYPSKDLFAKAALERQAKASVEREAVALEDALERWDSDLWDADLRGGWGGDWMLICAAVGAAASANKTNTRRKKTLCWSHLSERRS